MAPELKPIATQEWPEDVVPLVTVFNWTYNHREYIRDSIESILMQETDFPVEIIIHDDASSDGTAGIIKEYEARYPWLFRNIMQQENQWSQGKSVMTPMLEAPRGKYIALAHGDDFWTDPLKLFKQVRFLERNPEHVLSHTNTNLVYAQSRRTLQAIDPDYSSFSAVDKQGLFQQVATNQMTIRTGSVVFRKVDFSGLELRPEFRRGDTPLWLFLSQHGRFHYLHEPTMTYRVSRQSGSRFTSRKDELEFALAGFLTRFHYYKKYGYTPSPALIRDYRHYLRIYSYRHDPAAFWRADVAPLALQAPWKVPTGVRAVVTSLQLVIADWKYYALYIPKRLFWAYQRATRNN